MYGNLSNFKEKGGMHTGIPPFILFYQGNVTFLKMQYPAIICKPRFDRTICFSTIRPLELAYPFF